MYPSHNSLRETPVSYTRRARFYSTATVVELDCCCCIALLWWTGHDDGFVWMGRIIRGGHDGGWWKGVAMVMRAEHASSPLGCTPVKGSLDGKMGEKECSTTCCCWTWHTEPASAGGALWWPAAFLTRAVERKREWTTMLMQPFTLMLTSPVSDLLRSPLVTQCPKLVRVCGTDLVQRSQVTGQVRPKVLCGVREVRDILKHN